MSVRGGRELSLSSNEQLFIIQSLKQNLRVDGRSPLDYRNIEVKFGHTSGSVELSLGQTRYADTEYIQPIHNTNSLINKSVYNSCFVGLSNDVCAVFVACLFSFSSCYVIALL